MVRSRDGLLNEWTGGGANSQMSVLYRRRVYQQVDRRRAEKWSGRQTEDRGKVHWTAGGRVMVD